MKHRQDIDGLRSIAVLAVVLFHFGVSTMSGGYAGVDIFFVISGFLITSILIKDVEKQTFGFLAFYEKRIRRLFPALFATIIVSFVAGYFIFMPDEFREFGQSSIAAITYLSNLFFWFKSDYFAGPSELKPLLHTWSLAVEEQFYLIFPVVVWAGYKLGKKVFYGVVISLFIGSFVASIWYINISSSTVFFLSPFRFWELLAGSIVAILMKENIVPSVKVSSWLSPIGLMLIIVPIFMLNKQSLFPGWAAVPLCLGTALIIWANDHNRWIGRLLKLRFMQFTGKISYSMYLWHWPIVVFYGYWIIRDLVWWDTLLLLVVTYLVSYVSCTYLETPFRLQKGKSLKPIKVYATSTVFSLVIFALGVFIWKQEGLPNRFPVITEQITLTDSHEKSEFGSCFIQQDKDYEDNWAASSCIMKQQGASKTILLWGDSHAFHLVDGLTEYQQQLNANIVVYASAGCSPMFDTDIERNPQCKKNNNYVKQLLKTQKIDGVILAGNWAWAFKEKNENADLSSVARTLSELQSLGLGIFVVNQVPLYSVKNPQYLSARLASKQQPPINYYLAPSYGVGASEQLKRLIPSENLYSPQDLLCEKNKCIIYKDKQLMVVDEAHFSKKASTFVVEQMLPKMRLALKLVN